MAFWEMPANYYSFDQKGFHFVVLDANYLNKAGEYEDYSRAITSLTRFNKGSLWI